jgi:hypothetical protein
LRICARQQHVISVYGLENLENIEADGIFGLAPASARELLQTLHSQFLISHKTFSINLAKQQLALGFDPGGRNWIESDCCGDEQRWVLPLTSLAVGSSSQLLLQTDALFDTGSSNLMFGPSLITELLRGLEEHGLECFV